MNKEHIMKKVWVTGAGSFTAPYLEEALTEYGMLVASPKNLRLGEWDHIEHFLKEFKPSVILHLAGISRTDLLDPLPYFATNYQLTDRLLSILGRSNLSIDTIMLASTGGVYGASLKTISEKTRVAPLNHYSVSKLAMETLANKYSNLPITIVRPFNYTGIGQSEYFVIPKLVRAFQQADNSIELGDTDAVRDFSDVRDVCHAYAEIILSERAPSILNIASGISYSINEIFEKLQKITGHNMIISSNHNGGSRVEAGRITCDVSAINSIIKKRRYDIEETLSWMLESNQCA